MPAHSRPTIRILAEFRPPSAYTSFACCTVNALPAILAGTASPPPPPPACPPSSRNSSPKNPPRLIRFPAEPGTPRCNPDPPKRPCDRIPRSRLQCIAGATWGSDRRGVWVDRGCNGEFLVQPGSELGAGDSSGKSCAKTVGKRVAEGVERQCRQVS